MATLFERFKELWDRGESGADYNERRALEWDALAKLAWRIEMMPADPREWGFYDRHQWTELVKCANYAGASVEASSAPLPLEIPAGATPIAQPSIEP